MDCYKLLLKCKLLNELKSEANLEHYYIYNNNKEEKELNNNKLKLLSEKINFCILELDLKCNRQF